MESSEPQERPDAASTVMVETVAVGLLMTNEQLIAALFRCDLTHSVRDFLFVVVLKPDLNASEEAALQHLAHTYRRQLGGCVARYCSRCMRRGWRRQ
jgi:hypothetical protein